jgi:hypothetical protein
MRQVKFAYVLAIANNIPLSRVIAALEARKKDLITKWKSQLEPRGEYPFP